MDDAVVLRIHAVVSQSKLAGVLFQCVNLCFRYRILDGFVLIVSWCVVVGHADNLLRTETLQAPCPHTLEGLRRRHLVAIQAVYIQLCRPVLHLLHHVCVPYFVK